MNRERKVLYDLGVHSERVSRAKANIKGIIATGLRYFVGYKALYAKHFYFVNISDSYTGTRRNSPCVRYIVICLHVCNSCHVCLSKHRAQTALFITYAIESTTGAHVLRCLVRKKPFGIQPHAA